MENVVFIRFNHVSRSYHIWTETKKGTKGPSRDQLSRPWDGANCPGKAAPVGERKFLTDRERVQRDRPSKEQAQSIGKLRKGK